MMTTRTKAMFYKTIPEEDGEDALQTGGGIRDIEHSHLDSLQRARGWTRSHSIFQILNLVLLVVLVFLAIGNLVLLREQQAREASGWLIQREYGSDFHYMSLDPKYDVVWNEETNARNSLIYLSPYEENAEHPEVGSITMFHQLHCLTSLRTALQRAMRGEDIGVDWKDNVHWPHCLHYLRESILCFAEPTIERAPIVNGTRTRGISGAHDIRTCRDPRALYELRARSGMNLSVQDSDHTT